MSKEQKIKADNEALAEVAYNTSVIELEGMLSRMRELQGLEKADAAKMEGTYTPGQLGDAYLITLTKFDKMVNRWARQAKVEKDYTRVQLVQLTVQFARDCWVTEAGKITTV